MRGANRSDRGISTAKNTVEDGERNKRQIRHRWTGPDQTGHYLITARNTAVCSRFTKRRKWIQGRKGGEIPPLPGDHSHKLCAWTGKRIPAVTLRSRILIAFGLTTGGWRIRREVRHAGGSDGATTERVADQKHQKDSCDSPHHSIKYRFPRQPFVQCNLPSK